MSDALGAGRFGVRACVHALFFGDLPVRHSRMLTVLHKKSLPSSQTSVRPADRPEAGTGRAKGEGGGAAGYWKCPGRSSDQAVEARLMESGRVQGHLGRGQVHPQDAGEGVPET